ncbi:cytochrome c553 [Pasteurella langaaensis DSM 22999]|uniref:Cytochrome c553 n=1 Tax=Alitibacter langaaensis DSM 22999 TaxID=1122935 RepID=A0A2U0TA38_9PAST|nr:c-type cytochrome [Pasteurella langaaensis]PVX40448.1 cytochrome c553 [Pasteurella langaaensis DSM 22999]
MNYKKYLTVSKTFLILTALCSFSAQADNLPDIKQGERMFKLNCATCHGKAGEKQALGQSAVIRNLKKDEILTALEKRKSGEIVGAGNMAKERLNEQDMKNIAEFIGAK